MFAKGGQVDILGRGGRSKFMQAFRERKNLQLHEIYRKIKKKNSAQLLHRKKVRLSSELRKSSCKENFPYSLFGYLMAHPFFPDVLSPITNLSLTYCA
jgi:hypothetical protein